MKPKTITISSEVSEQHLIENCLMYYHSGYEYHLILFFHAMARRWHKDKLFYYLNLIHRDST